MVGPRWVLWVFLAAVASSGVGACGDRPLPSDPAYPFDPRQLLHTRDETFAISGYGDYGRTFYYATGGDGPGGGRIYWAVSTDDGSVRELGPTLQDPMLQPAGRFRCLSDSTGAGPGWKQIITDTQSGDQIVIDRLVSLWGTLCPDASGNQPAVGLRLDDAGRRVLWVGTYDNFQQAPFDLEVHEIVAFDSDALTLRVIAATSGRPQGWGLFGVDLKAAAVTEIIPPVLGEASWAPGAKPEGVLASESLSRGQNGSRTVSQLGHGGHYVFWRTMSNGGTAIFARPQDAGAARELALFRTDRPDGRNSKVDEVVAHRWAQYAAPGPWNRSVGEIVGWREILPGGAEPNDAIVLWDADRGGLASPCSIPAIDDVAAVESPDRRRVAFFTRGFTNGETYNVGPLLLVFRNLPDGTADRCRLLAAGNVGTADFSPDGSFLYWVTGRSTESNRELWLASADGDTPRRLAVGPFGQLRFISPSRLEFLLGTDLAWLDLREDPVRPHRVAANIFDYRPYDSHVPALPPRWQVLGYDMSAQDRAGTLGLVDWETGTKRQISRSVAWYHFLRDSASNLRRAVYFVRGRSPSPSDGLWAVDFTEDDFR